MFFNDTATTEIYTRARHDALPILRATITTKVQPGVVYTTFHNPETGANVVTTEYSDWATDCPEYKVTAVQVAPAQHRSTWQHGFDENAKRQGKILETT